MRVSDFYGLTEVDIAPGETMQGYWSDQHGQHHSFSGQVYEAPTGLAIGGWVFAYAGDNGPVLHEGVHITTPAPSELVPPVEVQAWFVLSGTGEHAIHRHAEERGDTLPGGRMHE